MPIEIHHSLYTGVEACQYFTKYIHKKFEKFRDKYGKKYLIHSIGIDYESKISVIAIVHPWDEFNPEIAKDIITGRIKREKGELNRRKYSEVRKFNEKTEKFELVGLPEYIEVGK